MLCLCLSAAKGSTTEMQSAIYSQLNKAEHPEVPRPPTKTENPRKPEHSEKTDYHELPEALKYPRKSKQFATRHHPLKHRHGATLPRTHYEIDKCCRAKFVSKENVKETRKACKNCCKLKCLCKGKRHCKGKAPECMGPKQVSTM